ncbi:hypothetical protein MBLNU459_g7880t1 [Dothideomycetes sp. NU459]
MKSRSNSHQPASVLLERSSGFSDLTQQLPHFPLAMSDDFAPFGAPTAVSPSRTPSQSDTRRSSSHDDPSKTPLARTSHLTQPPSHHADPASLTSSPMSTAGDASPWIGGTGLGSTSLGKSGRVIEKLMAENDRLRREMKAEIAKREELQRTAQTQKPRLESLQAENSRLSNIKAMDDSVIKRRDRKIEELKAELAKHETIERHLERRAESAERARDDGAQSAERAIQLAVEEAKHATTHAAVLQTSHRQLSAEYQQRAATLNRAVRDLAARDDDNRQKLGKLDVVGQKMRSEAERVRRLNADLVATWDAYHGAKEAELDGLRAELAALKRAADARELDARSKLADMQDLMHQMRWLMAYKKATDANGLTSPPPSPRREA